MKINKQFLPFIAFAILALCFGLWAGALRIGLNFPSIPNLALAHGPLMISGFLGILIPLERAVAMRKRWMFLVPILAAIGWVTALIMPNVSVYFFSLASFGAIFILLSMFLQEKFIFTFTMLLGAIAWFIGNILWMFGYPIFQVVYFWMTFLILTIAGERLELNRVLNLQPKHFLIFGLAVIALFASAGIAIFNLDFSTRVSGIALIVFSIWLLKYDIAFRNLRHPNSLTKFIAYALFTGFIWLGVSGLILLFVGAVYAGPVYDAALHAVFVGFVISMIFGHAPIIFSGIIGIPISYKPVFYIHLILLHASLIIRIFGNLTNQIEIRKMGGFLNGIAILLFIAVTIYSVVTYIIQYKKGKHNETH